MKSNTKIFIAVITLIVAVILATTTTFAWISLNNKVRVDAINVSVSKLGDVYIGNIFSAPTAGNKGVIKKVGNGFEATIVPQGSLLAPITATYINNAVNFIDLSNKPNTNYVKFDITFATVSPNSAVYLSDNSLKVSSTGADRTLTSKFTYYSAETTTGNYLYRFSDFRSNKQTVVVNDKVETTIADVYTDKLSGAKFLLNYDATSGALSATAQLVSGVTYAEPITRLGKISHSAIFSLRLGAQNTAVTSSNFVSVNLNPREGWDKYNNLKLAHDIYNIEADINGYARIPESFLKESILSEDFTRNKGVKLCDLVASDYVDESGTPLYIATTTIYLWLEGSDADCFQSVANQTIVGGLTFFGKSVQTD